MASRTRLKPRRRPRQARAQVTVEAILEGAAQVFQRLGYAAGTTDRIAERAGVSIGTLYQYFPNKDSILVALAERHIDKGFARMRAVLAEVMSRPSDLREALRCFVESMIELHSGEPQLHRVLFEEAPLPAVLRRRLRERELAFADELGLQLEMMPGVYLPDPPLAAYLVVQTVESLVHSFVMHAPPGVDAEVFCEELVRMLRGYLSGCVEGGSWGAHGRC
jgi:AcrR family transcriptional regulator